MRKGLDMRPSGRGLDEIRPVEIETGVLDHAEGSCRISCGRTQVICSASVEKRVPFFRRHSGLGWITAEYAMLPRATSTRNRRDGRSGNISGRTQEIQRLIGRSLRAGIDLAALGERQVIVDCDVVNADGGTRCASITGGWVALRIAVDKLLSSSEIKRDPVLGHVAGISCGIFAGQSVLDLDYSEDSEAETDANFVLDGNGDLIEVQCSAEGAPFPGDALGEFLQLARKGAVELIAAQKSAVGK